MRQWICRINLEYPLASSTRLTNVLTIFTANAVWIIFLPSHFILTDSPVKRLSRMFCYQSGRQAPHVELTVVLRIDFLLFAPQLPPLDFRSSKIVTQLLATFNQQLSLVSLVDRMLALASPLRTSGKLVTAPLAVPATHVYEVYNSK